MKKMGIVCAALFLFILVSPTFAQQQAAKTSVLVTSNGEIDDECLMVRFLLYANDLILKAS